MARTVTDAAILLGALAGRDPRDAATSANANSATVDYTRFLALSMTPREQLVEALAAAVGSDQGSTTRVVDDNIRETEVPKISRLPANNGSFRANMTLSEGSADNVAFVRIRDGYLVQELPFTIALTDFRMEHYATGQPKSFESDLVITDPDLASPLKTTIRVNHPFT